MMNEYLIYVLGIWFIGILVTLFILDAKSQGSEVKEYALEKLKEISGFVKMVLIACGILFWIMIYFIKTGS